jgi:NADH:ubiquinone oxidoreductase subunit D
VRGLVEKNRIFQDRTRGRRRYQRRGRHLVRMDGPVSALDRCRLDLRKLRPYYGYETFDFDIPVGANGDAFDRPHWCASRKWKRVSRSSIRPSIACPAGPSTWTTSA